MSKIKDEILQIYDIKEANKRIAEVVRQNINQLMEFYGITVSLFCDYMKSHEALAPHRTTFSKFMNGSVHSVSVAFLLGCCKCFELSLDNLLSENFEPHENSIIFKEKYAHLFEKKEKSSMKQSNYCKKISDILLQQSISNEMYIENPKSLIVKPYLQKYFCYYYSTVSSENKSSKNQDAILSGTLKLEEEGTHCVATLEIDTKTHDENGKPNIKIYRGRVVFCPSIQSVYCILALSGGEFCFLTFRYAHLNFSNQQCRLAEVLSTSSTIDKRYPIIHRMLLSKEELKDEAFEVIAPHLRLNSSNILIGVKELMLLKEQVPGYQSIIDEILETQAEPVYQLKEKNVVGVAQKWLKDDEISAFLTELRTYEYTCRYNKVSAKADNNVREALRQLGYYQT